jgi:hypothetical protein
MEAINDVRFDPRQQEWKAIVPGRPGDTAIYYQTTI